MTLKIGHGTWMLDTRTRNETRGQRHSRKCHYFRAEESTSICKKVVREGADLRLWNTLKDRCWACQKGLRADIMEGR